MNNELTSNSKIRVRYADTDQMKIVYYAKYLEYFEEARSDFFRGIGLPYSIIENENIGLPVVESKINYFAPAIYDDLLEVKTILEEITESIIKLKYEIRKTNLDKIIASGYTIHAFVDIEKRKSVRAPKFILNYFNKK